MNKTNERRERILRELSKTPISTIAKLSTICSVSTETIRKDLQFLSNNNFVIKVHGGVALANNFKEGSPYNIRTTVNNTGKIEIAKAACELIKPKDSIILENSTTTVELAKALTQKSELLKTLVIITNSLHIAQVFESQLTCSRLFLLGGWTNLSEYSTLGQYTVECLSRFHVDKTFISGAALNDDFLLTGYYEYDVSFQRQAIQCAKQSILLIDNSKLHHSAMLSVCPISSLDFLVTDAELSTKEQQCLKKQNVETIVTSNKFPNKSSENYHDGN